MGACKGGIGSYHPGMGFNPFRQQRSTTTDIFLVVLFALITFAFVAWAFLG